MSIDGQNVNHPEYREPLKEEKYEPIRHAIIASLAGTGAGAGVPFSELETRVADHLKSHGVDLALFPKPGSVRWYTKAVQLDLEARGLIERVPGERPMRLREVRRAR